MALGLKFRVLTQQNQSRSIPVSTVLTPQLFRDSLQTLSGIQKLKKDAIRGLEQGLNYRGKGDVHNLAWVSALFPIYAGGFMVASGLTPNEDSDITEGDWLIALTTFVSGAPITIEDLHNPLYFLHISFGGEVNINEAIDFVAFDGIVQVLSSSQIEIQEGDPVRLEGYPVVFQRYSQIVWQIEASPLDFSLVRYGSSVEFTPPAEGSYDVTMKVLDDDAEVIIEKTVRNFIVVSPVAGSAKLISSFVFNNDANNPDLTERVECVINHVSETITGLFPAGTSIAALRPVIEITGETVSPPSLAINNFESPTNYTVYAEDTTSKTYVATMQVAETLNPAYFGLSLTKDNITYDQGSSFDVPVSNEIAIPFETLGSGEGWYWWIALPKENPGAYPAYTHRRNDIEQFQGVWALITELFDVEEVTINSVLYDVYVLKQTTGVFGDEPVVNKITNQRFKIEV